MTSANIYESLCRPFPLLTLRAGIAGFLLWLGSWASIVASPLLPLLEETAAVERLTVGQGRGDMVITPHGIELRGTVQALEPYAENTIDKAAVFDFRLKKPLSLPADAKKIAFEYELSSSIPGNNEAQIKIKPLVRGRNGNIWAVATRFNEGTFLTCTRSPLRLETYSFSTAEIGRRDAWVMNSTKPVQFDEYSSFDPPYTLEGFRLVVTGKTNSSFALRLQNVQPESDAGKPSLYWIFLPETLWYARLGQDNPRVGGFGWGGANKTPLLKASDLDLVPGAYRFSWEILDVSEGSVVASDFGKITVADASLPFVNPPVLKPGTYHLRLAVGREEDPRLHDYFLTYVVVRAGDGAVTGKLVHRKAIQVEGWKGSVVSRSESPVLMLTYPSHGEAHLEWEMAAESGEKLKEGKTDKGAPAQIDLKEWSREPEQAFWLTARLVADGKEIDMVHRVIGFADAASAPAPASTVDKLENLHGQFMRTKADWSEGALPVATQPERMKAELEPWLDEAAASGYNTVELSATWCEINPLPGVYQFHYLDRIVEMARAKKLLVVLRIHPAPSLVPSWVERDFQQDQEGIAHGLWGGTNVLVCGPSSPLLQAAFKRYLHALAAHFRDDSSVLGYTLSSLYFDHDWLGNAWNALDTDYSEAARKEFCAYVNKSYHGDLAQVNAAYGTKWKNWEEIRPPLPRIEFDEQGRLKPRRDALWRDWMAFKVTSIRNFRIGGLEALREGDPACWIGFYASDSTALYLDDVLTAKCWLGCGSMESQFPLQNVNIHGRYEPIGKVARTAELVDLGISNLFLSKTPGFHGFSQYWMLPWRLNNVEPSVHAAEERLRQWFAVVDNLIGTDFVPENSAAPGKNGAYLVSYDTQLQVLGHTFFGRFDDYLKPYLFRVGTDKINEDVIHAEGDVKTQLDGLPYLYIPYATMVLTPGTLKAVADYVARGGRAVMESTSGYWDGQSGRANALASEWNFPPAVPQNSSPAEAETAVWEDDSPLQNVPLVFRTREFKPPINGQPTPWIHNIPRAFLRPYRWNAPLPGNSRIVARYADKSPAAVLLPQGGGEVLFFCGTIDWLASPGLNAALDAWGRGQTARVQAKSDPILLSRTLAKGKDVFAVGRRFIGQNIISELIEGHADPAVMQAESLNVAFSSGAPLSGRYRVREMIDGKDLGVFASSVLTGKGVSLSLKPGQAFLLEAVPDF